MQENNQNKESKPLLSKIDVDANHSDRKGLGGLVEGILRKFRMGGYVLMLAPIAVMYILCLGLALTPSIYIVSTAYVNTGDASMLCQALCVSFAVACAFIVFILAMILVVPAVNTLLGLPWLVKEARVGNYSLETIPWYYHNALMQLVRFTVLDFIVPTPLTNLYFRLMGMKMGKGCMINTSNISDACMIELGDNVTLGGSSTIFAHYGMKGFLVIAPTKIGSRTTIGLKASVLGDVIVGEKCMITPNTVLLPKTRIKDGEKV